MWAFSLPPSFHFPSTYVCDYRLIHIYVYMYIYNIHKYINILVISFEGELRASWLFIPKYFSVHPIQSVAQACPIFCDPTDVAH